MPELQTLAHGEQNWDSKVNAAIDYLNKTGEKVDNLKWTESTDEGIVLLNGFTGWISYSYLPVGDKKLVVLKGALKGNIEKGKSIEVLTIPDIIRPKDAIYQCTHWDKTYQITDNKLVAFAPNGDVNPTFWNVIFKFVYKI